MQMTDRNGNTDKLNQMMDEYGKGPVCIAFSGGVDSSLLLKIACDNGRKYKTPVYAVTFNTMLHPACDLDTAKKVARELGAEHVVIQVDELEMEGMRDNPRNAAISVKNTSLRLFSILPGKRGLPAYLTGQMKTTPTFTDLESGH